MKPTFIVKISVFLIVTLSTGSLFAQSAIQKEKFFMYKEHEEKTGYTQAVRVGNTIYISGSVGWDSWDKAVDQAFSTLERSLRAFGADFSNVVKETTYTTNIDSLQKYNPDRLKYYGNDFPAATWVQVDRLFYPNFVLEVDLIAVLPENAPTAFYQAKLFPNRDAFNLVFSRDGQSVYFSKAAPDYHNSDIYFSELQNNEWTEPKPAPFSGDFVDFDPFVSVDGKTLFFISNRPVNGKNSGMNIWCVKLENNAWGAPMYMGDVLNSSADDSFLSVAANGNLYFCSNRNNTDGTYDIYLSKFKSNRYEMPQKLEMGISTQAQETDPLIAPDESFMIFTRGDFFITFNKKGMWTTPVLLSELINTPDAHEYTPSFSPDGKYFYFCREKNGKRDLFQIETNTIKMLNGL